MDDGGEDLKLGFQISDVRQDILWENIRMQKGFWQEIDRPIIGLSPMDGVTDAPMRFIAKKYGLADVLYTEFVSAEGLWRIKKRGEMENKIWQDLRFDKSQGPNIAQIFGSDPESFYEAAKIICELGFDGVDINMGCPSPGLEKRGGGAGLIRDKCNAVEVVEATRRGVDGKIPVSLKTRIGSDKPDKKWWELLASMQMPAVAMHGRTFKQLYSGFADWDLLLEAGEIIRESGALFLGNGDIRELKTDKNQKLEIVTSSGREIDLTGKMDGVLIGRGAIGNPWILNKTQNFQKSTPTALQLGGQAKNQNEEIEERLSVAVEHARKFEEVLPEQKFFVMRKHLVGYASGFDNATELRKKLVMTNSAEEVKMVISDWLD